MGIVPGMCLFLSTPSARRATLCHKGGLGLVEISIHALREEGDIVQRPRRRNRAISIHALREEGDRRARRKISLWELFLSTPSARRATGRIATICNNVAKFLSTPSARRATAMDPAQSESLPYFYPRPPRGGRPPA